MAKKTKKRSSKGKQSLTILQKRFIDNYFSMEKPCAKEAYISAGYKCTGKTAETEAKRTLQKPPISVQEQQDGRDIAPNVPTSKPTRILENLRLRRLLTVRLQLGHGHSYQSKDTKHR